jgi:acyl-homoserine lactone acylase PvdQ
LTIFAIISLAFLFILTDTFSLISSPSYMNGDIYLDNFIESSKLSYDKDGVAYIKSKNDLDMYFTQGYSTAQLRLFQLGFCFF